jgi:hypothetical protein
LQVSRIENRLGTGLDAAVLFQNGGSDEAVMMVLDLMAVGKGCCGMGLRQR